MSDNSLRQKLSRILNEAQFSYKDRRQALKTACGGIQDRHDPAANLKKLALVENGLIEVLLYLLKVDEKKGLQLDSELKNYGNNIWDEKAPECKFRFQLIADAALYLARLTEVGNEEGEGGSLRIEKMVQLNMIEIITPHLYHTELAAQYISGVFKELATYEKYRLQIIHSSIKPLCALLHADVKEEKTSFRNAAVCVHLLSCSSTENFESLGILKGCLTAATSSGVGDKIIMVTAITAANIAAGRDGDSRINELFKKVAIGSHICRSLHLSIPSTPPKESYFNLRWSHLDILKSTLLLAASESGRKQLIDSIVKDTATNQRLNIVDLLTMSLKLVIDNETANGMETKKNIEEILLHLTFCKETLGMMLSQKGDRCIDLLKSCNDIGSQKVLFMIEGKITGQVVVHEVKKLVDHVEAIPPYPSISNADGHDGKDIIATSSCMESDAMKSRQHVMISYSWAYQDIILQLCSRLRASNIPYWLDVEQMKGNVNDCMSDAVERSKVVLIAVSSKYKLSANCRMEAEYSVAQKKSIIPVLTESGYVADGWLGFLIGGKLWYDLSNTISNATKETNMNNMIQILKSQLNNDEEDTAQKEVTSMALPDVYPLEASNTKEECDGLNVVRSSSTNIVELLQELQMNMKSFMLEQTEAIMTKLNQIDDRVTRIERSLPILERDRHVIK